MARSFDGANTKIAVTITDISAVPYTFGAWIFATSAGEGSAGRILRTELSNAGTLADFLCNTGPVLQMQTNYVTTNANAVSSTALTASKWWCVFGQIDASNVAHVFQGSQSAAVAENAYTTHTTGVGGATTGAATLMIGNRSDQTGTFAGNIAHACVWQRALSLAEMEMYRCGIILRTGLYSYNPLTSPTATQVEEIVSQRASTWTAGTGAVVEDPPFHMRLENWT